MTQFHGDGEHEENNGKVIAFMGDCDENGAQPYPVRPLVNLGWKWGPMKGSYDTAAYATYFGDPANRKNYRNQQRQRNPRTKYCNSRE